MPSSPQLLIHSFSTFLLRPRYVPGTARLDVTAAAGVGGGE